MLVSVLFPLVLSEKCVSRERKRKGEGRREEGGGRKEEEERRRREGCIDVRD